MDTRPAHPARPYVYVGIVFLITFLAVAAYFKELQLAISLYRHEGGETAFTSKPRTAHFVGTAINAPFSSTLFVIADSGNVGAVATIHRDGCFVLAAANPQATLSLYAPDYMRVLTQVGTGYFYVRLHVSPVKSGKPSSLTLTRISPWDFIRRAVECTSSP